jgi:hypothetical protein
MKRLWIREVRRAARRASDPFARQVALGCGAAVVGTMVASPSAPASRWRCGASRMGRRVGGSRLRSNLDRALHWLLVAVSI